MLTGISSLSRLRMAELPDSKTGRRSTLPQIAVTGLAVTLLLAGDPNIAAAQPDSSAAARAGAIEHAQKMRRLFPDRDADAQVTPSVIPKFQLDLDPSGAIASFQPNGPTFTGKSAFFLDLGSNGRTCFTCHQPQDGWSLSGQHAQDRFRANSNDPLFRLVDGATCPSDDVSTPQAKRKAYQLLLTKGLIRVGLPIPSQNLQFQIVGVADPYACSTNPATGLTGSSSGVVSVYRRPLPAANLGFLSTIMWDGREPSLFSQALDATLGHAQAQTAPTEIQKQQIVNFEGCTLADNCKSPGLFTTQLWDNRGSYLSSHGANGGPKALSQELSGFFIGTNDPLGQNPTGAPFTAQVFDLYGNWTSLPGGGPEVHRRKAIARGEQLFNATPISITGVAGLNDALNQQSIPGFCGTCHDSPNVGNHSVKAPLNIGIADAGQNSPPALDIAGLPVFTIWCTSGPLAGRIFEVTDPGRALITGQCADIGKLKGPILRGLAARAPYFHNGAAATLLDVVNFYDQRFNIGFTDAQKDDLVAFLSAL